MVTWTNAFRAAALFVAYSIIWDILGTTILTFGLVTVGSTSFLTGLSLDPYQFAVGITISLIGFIILMLGNIATFFKVNTDTIMHDIEEHLQREEPIPAQ